MRIVNLGLSQTNSREKIPEALPMRQLISVSIDAFEVILEVRYTFLTFLMQLSSILIVGGIHVPWLRTGVGDFSSRRARFTERSSSWARLKEKFFRGHIIFEKFYFKIKKIYIRANV